MLRYQLDGWPPKSAAMPAGWLAWMAG